MIVPLHHVQGVVRQVLVRHVPGRVQAVGAAAFTPPADAQALALAQGVERQADVAAHLAALRVQHGAGFIVQVALQESAKGPLADEADAGGVLLGRHRQADLRGDAPHLGLGQFAHRE